MASLADKNLSQAAQDKINQITEDAKAGKTTWAEANKAANAVRASEGANYSVSVKGDTSYKDGSSISSDKTGNKVSGGGSAQRDYDDYSSSYTPTFKAESSGGSSTDLVKGPGYVTGGYQTGVLGSPILGDNPYWNKNTTASGADMSRRPDLAGKYATSNGYTVFYDENGYAYKAVKGSSDYLPNMDLNAGNGTYNQQGAWTDNEMLPKEKVDEIADYRAMASAGKMTWAEANQKANAIRANYGYIIDNKGNVYDSGVGSSVAANRNNLGIATDLTDAQQKYLELMFPEQQTTDSGSLLNAFLALKNGTYDPNTKYTGFNKDTVETPVISGGGTTSDGSTGGTTIPDTSGGTGGTGNTAGTVTNTDLTDYLKELYARNLEAQLANLKSTYDTNVADLEAQQKDIKQQFQSARNQTAAQYDLGRMRFNEYALANGLNTGTAGQGVLAQSAAYQGNLSNIGTQEASAMSDNSLQLTKLEAQYNAAINEAKATGDFQLAQALYDELVRQENVAIQQQQAALEQQNWERQFAWQQQQANLSQSNWERQFAYQQMLNGQDYSVTQQQLAAQAQERAYDYAMTLLSSGVMPDSVTLNSAGISANEAALMQQIVLASKGQTTNKSGSTTSTVRNPSTTTGGYNNGSLTTEQVKQLQQKLGVTADGKWGSKSSTAAGGLTADEAWAKYGGYDMSFEELKSTITRYLSLGGAQRAQNILDAHWDSLTPAQQLELSNLFG